MRSYPGGIRHDYKDSAQGTGAFNPRGLSWFAIGLLLPVVFVLLLLVSEPNESMVPAPATLAPDPAALALANVPDADQPAAGPVIGPVPVSTETAPRRAVAVLSAVGERVALDLPPLASAGLPGNRLPRPEELERSALLSRGELLSLKVRSGDSLDRLFRRNDLSITDLAGMLNVTEARTYLTSIRPGDEFEIIHDGERVLSLSREISESQRLWVKQDGEGYTAEVIDLETEIRTAGAHGVIESSLWNAATAAGLDFGVIEEIAGIFEWDIDFQLEVREGDSFTVVYEELWRDGVKLRNGSIIAAEFVNRGDVYRAARYVDATGDADYYTPEGMNVRRPFLRNPIEFTRISSNFNPNRRHPILNTIRAHRGVDLAAPSGTPIRAAGDGKIIARGAYGSFGNRVEIQHGGGVTTLYAHMSKFGQYGVGARVKQGDIIGYVGMTGGATGPHLHYEYRLNGVHQNPRTVELPDAEPINREYLDDFRQTTASLWHQLDLYEGSLLASNAD